MVSQQSDRIDAGTPAYGSIAKASPLADAARFLDLPHPRSAKLVHAFLAGFIASLALLIVFALAYALALIIAGALPTDRTVLSTIVGNLVLHAVYGVVLARLYGPFGEMLDSEQQLPSEAQKAALACCESAAVRGLAVGVLLGGLLGGTVLLIASEKGGAPFLGMHPLGVLLEAILSGASVGASAGALVGT